LYSVTGQVWFQVRRLIVYYASCSQLAVFDSVIHNDENTNLDMILHKQDNVRQFTIDTGKMHNKTTANYSQIQINSPVVVCSGLK